MVSLTHPPPNPQWEVTFSAASLSEVKVTFAADAAVYQRDYAEEVYEILEKAQITYAQKTEVYKVVKELGTEAVPVLVSMNLNPSLLGVLMEILTMGI